MASKIDFHPKDVIYAALQNKEFRTVHVDNLDILVFKTALYPELGDYAVDSTTPFEIGRSIDGFALYQDGQLIVRIRMVDWYMTDLKSVQHALDRKGLLPEPFNSLNPSKFQLIIQWNEALKRDEEIDYPKMFLPILQLDLQPQKRAMENTINATDFDDYDVPQTYTRGIFFLKPKLYFDGKDYYVRIFAYYLIVKNDGDHYYSTQFDESALMCEDIPLDDNLWESQERLTNFAQNVDLRRFIISAYNTMADTNPRFYNVNIPRNDVPTFRLPPHQLTHLPHTIEERVMSAPQSTIGDDLPPISFLPALAPSLRPRE